MIILLYLYMLDINNIIWQFSNNNLNDFGGGYNQLDTAIIRCDSVQTQRKRM